MPSVNSSGTIVGWYTDTINKNHGFLYAGGTFTTIDAPGGTNGTSPNGIDDSGRIVGNYTDATNRNHGFLYEGGTFTTIDVPPATNGTVASGINNNGLIAGYYANVTGFHGYVSSGSNLVGSIDFPGALSTTASGINLFWDVVGSYVDAAWVFHGFLYRTVGLTFATIDFPGATATFATGINHSSRIVGYYWNASGVHGFLATPPSIPCQQNTDCSSLGSWGFCQFPDGMCSSGGVCGIMPDSCPNIDAPVCGCNGVTYPSSCNANLNGVSILQQGPCTVIAMSVAPPFVNFGNVNTGQSATQTLTIANQVDLTSALTGNVGTLSAPFSVTSGSGAFNLNPGQSVSVTVQFLPTTAGPASGTLSITHNAANRTNPASIALSGTGVIPPCSFSISPSSANMGAGGGTGSVAVTAGAGCAWGASGNAGSWDWMGISSGTSGSGNGTVTYNVLANNTGGQRTGTLAIAGQTFTLTQQAGGGCTYSISPTSNTMGAGGGTGSVGVTAGAGCAWTASTNAGSWDWMGISSGSSGSGNGTVTLAIAGQTFTVTQGTASTVTSVTVSTTPASPQPVGASIAFNAVAVGGVSPQYYFTWRDTGGVWHVGQAYGASASWSWNTTGLAAGTYTIQVWAKSTGSTSAYDAFTSLSYTLTGSCASISPTSNTMGAGGGTGSVAVTAGAGCAWTASTNAGSWDWMGISSGSSGSGNGTVTYNVLANNTGSQRTGTLAIAGQTFTLTQQAGGGCTYSISPTSNTFAGGGSATGAVSVFAGAGCTWTASTNAGSWAWVGITSGTSGSGNGTVNYVVLANNTGSTRTGTLTIAGQTHTITQQSGGGCSYSISPTSNTFAKAGGTGGVSVTAGAGCAWTASTNSGSWDWVGISSGTSGSGNGTVNYLVLANNTGSTRTGTVAIAGQTFTITQYATGNKVAFVTSVSGSGNLGSWPDAGGQTGTAAGDAICQARAAAGGLENPSQFRAWLSDQNSDAHCRIHNLTGKKSANCGQATLPVAAGPWVRTDGFPFGATIDQILEPNNIVYAPVRYNEFGSQAPAGTLYFTDTQWNGTFPPAPAQACSNWTSASGSMDTTSGSAEMTSGGWSWYAWASCTATYPLLCLQTGAGPSLPSHVSSGKKVFLTSVDGNGNLGSWPDAGGSSGIAAGDAICQARATAAGLSNPTHFKAWLSDSTTNAKDRINSNGPWVRLDGVLIANSKADLLDGSLFTGISVTETMNYNGSWANVWTGTATDGNKATDHCSNWTSSSSGTNGRTGSGNHTGQRWTDHWSAACNTNYRSLYCIED